MSLLLRIRTQIGTWRVKDVSPTDNFRYIRERVEKEHKIDLEGRPFTSDPGGKFKFDETETVKGAKLKNGDMIYAMIDDSKMGVHEAAAVTTAKKITKDGNIVAQDIDTVLNSSGFRPGMMPLRSMKMQWTLNEFVSLDSQFEFKIKAQEKAFCTKVSVDSAIISDFQNYMRNFDFRVMR